MIDQAAIPETDDASPRVFLLALLRAFACDVQVQLLIRASALFDIDENRTRVALHRLRSKGVIESKVRGTYRVANDAITSEHLSWRNVLSRITTWNGRWIAVYTGHLPRADKTIARRRDKATNLLGLRDLESGLLVRPNNLEGGVEAVRARLSAFGLETNAVVATLSDLGEHEERARALWNDLKLDVLYREGIERIEQAMVALPAMPIEEAARQAFVTGGRSLHDIIHDPLLPAPLVDPALRESFVKAMVTFDDLGREIWSHALESNLTLRQAPTADLVG